MWIWTSLATTESSKDGLTDTLAWGLGDSDARHIMKSFAE